MWGFPEIGVPQNGWFIKEHPIKMDDLGVLLFLETSMSTQLSTVKACQTDLFVSSCYLQKRKIHGTHDASMGRRVYVPIHENHTNQLDSWIGKYTVRRMDASWMGVSSQQQRLAGETPPLCWGTSNEGCPERKICHAENQQHVVIQVVGQEGYPIYASVSRVATPPHPPPYGMGPKPTFWLHFHGTRRNTWYLQCFDKLGLRNRGICSVL